MTAYGWNFSEIQTSRHGRETQFLISLISTLSVVLVKQLTAVPGLIFLLVLDSVGRFVETTCRCTWLHLFHGSLSLQF